MVQIGAAKAKRKAISVMVSSLFWECYAVKTDSYVPTFRDNLAVPSSRIKQSKKNFGKKIREQ